MGAAETLIVWDNLDINHYDLKNYNTGEEVTLQLRPEQEKNKTYFIDKETGAELELVDKCPLLEWLANEYKHLRATLEIVADAPMRVLSSVKDLVVLEISSIIVLTFSEWRQRESRMMIYMIMTTSCCLFFLKKIYIY